MPIICKNLKTYKRISQELEELRIERRVDYEEEKI